MQISILVIWGHILITFVSCCQSTEQGYLIVYVEQIIYDR